MQLCPRFIRIFFWARHKSLSIFRDFRLLTCSDEHIKRKPAQSIAKLERQSNKNSRTIGNRIDSATQIDRKQLQMLSEIFRSLLGCHGELRLGLWKWRAFSCKGELEVVDDFVYVSMGFNECDYSHSAMTFGVFNIFDSSFPLT